MGTCNSSYYEWFYDKFNIKIKQTRIEKRNGKIFDYYINKTLDGYSHKSTFSYTILSVIQEEKDYSLVSDRRYFVKEITKLQHKDMLNEINIAKTLLHPNLLLPQEYFENEKYYWTVYPTPMGRSLMSFIQDNTLVNDLRTIFDIVRQLLQLTIYLHDNNIIHRNLNPEIIWFNYDICKIWLFDLETAKYHYYPVKEQLNTNVIFTAPEMIENYRKYSFEVDIWSIGVIFFTLIYGHSPYDIKKNHDLKDVKHKIISYEIFRNSDCQRMIDEEIRDYLDLFLETDPAERSKPHNLIDHPTMLKYSNRGVDFEQFKFILETTLELEVEDIFANVIGSYCKLHNEKEINYLYNSIDFNKDGVIDKDEFKKVLKMAVPKVDEVTATNKIFTYVDRKQGFIDYRDFRIINFKMNFTGVMSKELGIFQDKMKKMDVSNEYKVNFEDFVNILEIDSCYILYKLVYARDYVNYYDPVSNTIYIKEFVKSLSRGTEFYNKFMFNMNIEKLNIKPNQKLTKREALINNMRTRYLNLIEFKKSINVDDGKSYMVQIGNESNISYRRNSMLGSFVGNMFNQSRQEKYIPKGSKYDRSQVSENGSIKNSAEFFTQKKSDSNSYNGMNGNEEIMMESIINSKTQKPFDILDDFTYQEGEEGEDDKLNLKVNIDEWK